MKPNSACQTGFALVGNKISNMSFVCAMLVVVIHCGCGPTRIGTIPWIVYYLVRYVFATIAVPFFFLVSGFFLARHTDEHGWWKQAIVKRLNTLVIPFFLWLLIPFFIKSILLPFLSGAWEGAEISLNINMHSFLTAFGLNLFSMPTANGPLWFVRSLMFLIFISPILVLGVRKLRGYLLCFLFLLYLIINPGHVNSSEFWISEKWRLFWRFGFSVEGLFYFSLGLYLWWHNTRVTRKIGLIGIIGVVIASVRIVLLVNNINDFGYIVALSTPMILLGVWAVIPVTGCFKSIIRCSFPLYVMHPMVIGIYKISTRHLSCACGGFLVEWVSVVCFVIAITLTLRKLFPKMMVVLCGGR